MEVSPKKRKIEKEDRISQLPDPILQDIISLIHIEEAVASSLLSKGWKNLWLIWFSLSDLDLDFNLSRLAAIRRVNLKDSKAASQEFFHRFARSVEQFLSRCDHNSTLRKFHLSLDCDGRNLFREESHAAFVERCVDYAINHGAQVLHLHGIGHRALRLPEAFSACETVRELELRPFENDVDIPKWFSSKHLKTLYLENADFTIDEHEYFKFLYTWWKEPFSRFPGLEKLTLHGCRTVWECEFCIACPRLRYLEIINDNREMLGVDQIWTPNLTCFRYQGNNPLQCAEANFPMLEEAYLNINLRYRNIRKKADRFTRLLKQLGNAKIVTLSLDVIKALETDLKVNEQSPSSSPIFPYLKHLKLLKVKRRREFPTSLLKRVINYLTREGSSVVVELPVVDEDTSQDLFEIVDSDDLHLQRLFQVQDYD